MNFLIIFGAKYLYVLIALVAFVVFLLSNKRMKSDFFKLALFTFPLTFVLAKILGYFINDPRPFVVEHIQPLIYASADNGFPSDHTLLSMTLALVIFTYNRKVGSVLIVLALLVGIARVLAHAHHFTDIVGSIVITVISIFITRWLIKKLNIKLPVLGS